jgi:hypothetical protein
MSPNERGSRVSTLAINGGGIDGIRGMGNTE